MKSNAMKHVVAIASLCGALAIASPVYAADAPAPADKAATTNKAASTDMKILQEKIHADKKLLVSENMVLTEEEAKKFWPVYDEYQKDLGVINKRLGAAIKRYADAYNAGAIPDAVATELTNESIAIDAAEAEMRKMYAAKVMKVLPAAKAARYMQIENKIRALVRLELAANIPLAK